MDEEQPRADLTPPGFAPPDARPEPDPRFLDAPPPVPWEGAPPAPAPSASAPPSPPYPGAPLPAPIGFAPAAPAPAGPAPLPAGGLGAPLGWGDNRPPRRRRWRRPAVAAVVVLALSGGGAAVALRPGQDPPGSTRSSAPSTQQQAKDAKAAKESQQRSEAIATLVETMNTALAGKDEKAFTSVVLPGSAAFLKHQQQVFRGLKRVPFSAIRYDWARQSYLTVPGLDGRYPGGAYVAEVTRRYTLAGWDPEPVTELLGLTFTRSPADGRWYLAADTDGAEQLPYATDTEPWQLGDVSVASTSRVLVIGDANAASTTKRLARKLDGLVGDVATVWRTPSWNGRVVVYSATASRFVTAWFGDRASTGRRTESTDPATFDAVVGSVWTTQSTFGPTGDPAGTRMVLTPALVRSKDSAYVDQVLRHELTHVLTDGIGAGPPPVWMVEGIAEYTSVRSGGSSVDGVAALQKRGLTSGEWKRLKSGSFKLALMTDPRQFYAGSSETVSDHYTSAWFACLYIADHYGEKKLVRLYTRAAELATTGSTDQQVEARAIKEVLGATPKALTKATLSYARTIRRRFV